MEAEATLEEARERLQGVGEVDLVVGLPHAGDNESVAKAIEAVRAAVLKLPTPPRTVILHSGAAAAPADEATPGANGSVRLLAYPLPPLDATSSASGADPYRALLGIGQTLTARASVVIGSELASVHSAGAYGLIQSILDLGFDLAAPLYPLRKLEGLINSGIVYPMTRALYGRQIHFPMGIDLGFSAKLGARLLQPDRVGGPSPWITNRAVCEGFQVCQVNLDFHPPQRPDSGDLSAVLSEVLGSLFLDTEQNAPCWQKVRGSQPVRTFGASAPVADAHGPADVTKMIESFQLAYRNLREVWGLVLPPASLVELKKLTEKSADSFRMSDELWARIVYDFALGYRLRPISRDHLLRALTPAYLAWVASHVLEVQNAGTAEVANRLERLCITYEAQKPYLLSRWRWPDRFNP